MTEFIYAITTGILSSIVQMAAGSILASLAYLLMRSRLNLPDTMRRNKTAVIVIASLTGILLPLNIYGVIPLIGILSIAGFRSYSTVPIVISNFIFNVTDIFSAPAFIWSATVRRLTTAFIIGASAGILIKMLNLKDDCVIRREILPVSEEKTTFLREVARLFNDTIAKTGLYMIAGVIADVVFQMYIFPKLISFIYSDRYMSSIPSFFMGLDNFSPLFIESTGILFSFLDITDVSALLLLFKPKSFLLCLVYYTVWAILLAVIALL